ncbi:MAG: DegT/DnrJ/EryC1/StrS family aminotransferase [Ardenticatenaceae bacterium]|nr:DegT/DnrJ/EryC1/StrS family aminotransferase [Ardenticatenaceae bacterium]
MIHRPAIAGGAPVRDTFLVFGSPLIGEAEIAEVVDTLRSGWLGTGPKTKRFEEAFKTYIGARHAVALNSATAGLHLALDVAGVQPGTEVITTAMTFASTANVVVHLGGTPVFVDCQHESMNIDPGQIEAAITPRTRAIIPVHMAGRAADMDAIMAIAQHHEVIVVEDAAHAIETRYQGRSAGTLGHMAAFSFYVTKNVVTGEGGMLTTDRDHWAEEARLKSLHGISKDAWKRYSAEGFTPYETVYPGYKYNMMDIQASLGLHQLAAVEANLLIRERHWRAYDEGLGELDSCFIPAADVLPGNRHARHLYTLLLNLEALRIDRNSFINALKAENIGAGVHFTALHLHRFYRERFGYAPGRLPVSEWIGERTVSLPLSAKLIDQDVRDVIVAVRRLLAWYRR